MLLYAGVILIAVSILFIIMTIVMLSYKSRHDKVVERFQRKGNKILTWYEIDNLCKEKNGQCETVMKIFNSAVITHAAVDGIRYYTKYPHSIFRIFSGNDSHRRTLIANRIGEIAQEDKLRDDQVDMAVTILKRLTNSRREYNYTQLIAWNSLAKIACYKKSLLGTHIKKKELLKSLSKKGIESIGAQKFIYTLLDKKDWHNGIGKELKEIIKYIFTLDNFTIKAILYYKIKTSACFDEEIKATLLKGITISPRLADFIMRLDYFSYGYTLEELTIGLKNLGFCNPPYFKSSSEAKIVSILIKDCLVEVGMPAVIYLFDVDRLKEKASYENMTLFERDDPRRRHIIGAQNIESLFNEKEERSRNNDTSSMKPEKEEDCEDGFNKKREGLFFLEKEIKNIASNIANTKGRRPKK